MNKLDTRKEVAAYISGQTTPGRVCVTNAGGELSSSSIALAELALLSGVTSSIQTQRDAISAASVFIVGAASTVVDVNLTKDRVLLSSAIGKIEVAPTTAQQLATLDATSSVQTQLDGKQSSGDYATNTALASGLASKQPVLGTGSILNVGGVSVVTHAPERVLVSGLGGVITSAVTVVELGHLQGVTAGLQSQLNALAIADGMLGSSKQDVGSYATTTELATKQPLIGDDHLDITHVAGLSTSLTSIATSLELTSGLSTKQSVGDYATNS